MSDRPPNDWVRCATCLRERAHVDVTTLDDPRRRLRPLGECDLLNCPLTESLDPVLAKSLSEHSPRLIITHSTLVPMPASPTGWLLVVPEVNGQTNLFEAL